MPEIPRLNGVIKTLQEGKIAFAAFTPVDIESAVALAASSLDGVVFEMEHGPLDPPGLRSALQFMLDRRQIVDSGTLAPRVTPIVRIPPNGGEMNQWIAKQVLDIGVFGIVFPHISTVEEAWNAVGTCRYPRLKEAPLYNPPGIRGDAHQPGRKPEGASHYRGVEPFVAAIGAVGFRDRRRAGVAHCVCRIPAQPGKDARGRSRFSS